MLNKNKVRIVILVFFGIFLSTCVWAQQKPGESAQLQGVQPTIKDTRGQADATPMPLPGPDKTKNAPSFKEKRMDIKDKKGQADATPMPLPGPDRRNR